MTSPTPSTPVVRRKVAALLLQVKPAVLDDLQLRRWKEGRATFYDSAQIMALIKLREYWITHHRAVAR